MRGTCRRPLPRALSLRGMRLGSGRRGAILGGRASASRVPGSEARAARRQVKDLILIALGLKRPPVPMGHMAGTFHIETEEGTYRGTFLAPIALKADTPVRRISSHTQPPPLAPVCSAPISSLPLPPHNRPTQHKAPASTSPFPSPLSP